MKAVFYPPAQALISYHYFAGAGPTHVYLAGLGAGSTGIYPSVIYGSALARYHSLMPDVLGFGYSDRPQDFGYTVEEHADTIAFLLDKLQAGQCTVIGHSFGGAVAIVLATKRPDLVARLVLAESVLDAADWFHAGTQSEEQFIASGHSAVLERFRRMLPDYAESNRGWFTMFSLAAPHAFYRTALSLVKGAQPTWREQLYRLKIPRLYLLGEMSLQMGTHRREDELPDHGVPVAVIAQAGHGMIWENPEAFVRAIVDFEAG